MIQLKFLDLTNENSSTNEKILAYLNCHERDWVPDQELIFNHNLKFDWKQIYKILEPYYTTKVNGTGLGLAISKKIIEDHNGTIHLNSEVDEGTCVKIKFPLSK